MTDCKWHFFPLRGLPSGKWSSSKPGMDWVEKNIRMLHNTISSLAKAREGSSRSRGLLLVEGALSLLSLALRMWPCGWVFCNFRKLPVGGSGSACWFQEVVWAACQLDEKGNMDYFVIFWEALLLQHRLETDFRLCCGGNNFVFYFSNIYLFSNNGQTKKYWWRVPFFSWFYSYLLDDRCLDPTTSWKSFLDNKDNKLKWLVSRLCIWCRFSNEGKSLHLCLQSPKLDKNIQTFAQLQSSQVLSARKPVGSEFLLVWS